MGVSSRASTRSPLRWDTRTKARESRNRWTQIMAPLVRKAFELYATGRYNIDTLGDELYRLGLRTGNGTRMSRGGLAKLLNSQFYIGLIHIRRTGETFQGKHRPLISKSLFDRVQAVLSGKAQTQGLRHDFLYRRRLRCVHCGYLLIAEIQKGRPYYRCHTKACPTTCLREDSDRSSDPRRPGADSPHTPRVGTPRRGLREAAGGLGWAERETGRRSAPQHREA